MPEVPAHESFLADLRGAAALWSTAPLLPVITVGLAVTAEGLFLLGRTTSRPLGLLALPVQLFLVGWVGTERIWYLRLFSGAELRRDELWPLTLAFLGRFCVLGFALGFFALVVLLPAVGSGARVGGKVAFVAVVLLGDAALTFVTPILAFSVNSVTYALGFGLTVIRQQWPRCVWYVLTPPLALTAMTQLLPRHGLGPVEALATTVVLTLFGLACKGATAAFYLRRYPAETEDGAAHLDRRWRPRTR